MPVTMGTVAISLNIPILDNSEIELKKKALDELAKNLSTENLVLLASKSRTFGINQKIQMFKNLI